MGLADIAPKNIAELGSEVELLHPTTNARMGVFLILCGSDSDTFRGIIRRQQNRRLERTKQARNNKPAPLTPEELEEESMDLLVGCTKGWLTRIKDEKGIVTETRQELDISNDEWLPCTPDNIRRLYNEVPWVKEQADYAIGDRSNFLKR